MNHRLNIEPAQTTLIPRKLFIPEWVDPIVHLNFECDPKEQIILSEEYGDLVFLSVLDKKKYTQACELFPQGTFFSTYRLLFQTFEKIAKSDKKNRYSVFANFSQTSFDLFIFEKQQPIFVNTFAIHSTNDAMFYLLQVMNRLKIDTGGLRLRIIDSMRDSRDLIAVLESHFLSVEKFSEKENPLNFRVSIQEGFSLVNTVLCE